MTFVWLVLGLVVLALVLVALRARMGRGLSIGQALLYAPLKIAYRVRADALPEPEGRPTLYVLAQQAGIDAALAMSLLPRGTVHFLKPHDMARGWLAPWRALADVEPAAGAKDGPAAGERIEAALRERGAAAVYLAPHVEPDERAFADYAAAAEAAARVGAAIVALHVGESRFAPSSLHPPEDAPRRLFPPLTVTAVDPVAADGDARGNERAPADILHDRVTRARFEATDLSRGLFLALRDAARRHARVGPILEDPVTGRLTYRRLLIGANVLGRRFAALSRPGEAVGLLLPTANAAAISFFALQSAARVPAMLNYTAGPAANVAAIETARIRTVISSRAFIEKAELEDLVAAIEENGTAIVYLEDVRKSVGTLEKLAGALLWWQPLAHADSHDTAAILFTSGSEGKPKGVALSHRNLIANAAQADARIDFSCRDTLFNVLPAFHSFGLLGGMILPLLYGVRLYLYPSPLHYKLIPEIAREVKPTVMFGTDTFLAGYARTASEEDFASLRMIVAGAEPVKPETRRTYRERFDVVILEGYGVTEASPVIAVNSARYGKEGSVGRLLTAMDARLEPVEGIEGAGRLHVTGPNVMKGYVSHDRPGELVPLETGWHDTGDIVALDAQGFVTIRGRAKRFAKIAGEMISLGAVEMLVQNLWPEGYHAAVSVPDKRRGERIVLLTTTEPASKDALRRHSREAGATELMVPDIILNVDEIPVLGSGKVDYVASRELALERLEG